MLRHLEKLLIVLLMVVALLLWWPLVQWQPIFASSPTVSFNVPAFKALDFTATPRQLPSLPHLSVLKTPTLTPVQVTAMRAAGLPVFAVGTEWWIGPYLLASEAQIAQQQVSHSWKIPVTMADYGEV